jgi:hypothetical protein
MWKNDSRLHAQGSIFFRKWGRGGRGIKFRVGCANKTPALLPVSCALSAARPAPRWLQSLYRPPYSPLAALSLPPTQLTPPPRAGCTSFLRLIPIRPPTPTRSTALAIPGLGMISPASPQLGRPERPTEYSPGPKAQGDTRRSRA